MEALQVEAKEMTTKYTEARKRSDQLERDLKLAMQETQAQSTALNRLTSHVLQRGHGGPAPAGDGYKKEGKDAPTSKSGTGSGFGIQIGVSNTAPTGYVQLVQGNPRDPEPETASAPLPDQPFVIQVCPKCQRARELGAPLIQTDPCELDPWSHTSSWRERVGGPLGARRSTYIAGTSYPSWSMLEREADTVADLDHGLRGGEYSPRVRSGQSTPRSKHQHPLSSVLTRLASKGEQPRNDAAVDNYDLYLQVSEEKHKLQQDAAREKDAIIKELERTKEELKRSTRTAADAIESRDEMMSRSKVDVERMKRKMLQYEEYSAELERQLRSERLHKSALSHDLQATATSSSIAEASMSQTIDKQHAKNLDLLHALATVADHKHSHTAKGDAAHARNPILAT